jgi:hypothetical protein
MASTVVWRVWMDCTKASREACREAVLVALSPMVTVAVGGGGLCKAEGCCGGGGEEERTGEERRDRDTRLSRAW